MAERALPYKEPAIVAILILSSFLYLLNVINDFLDRWIYCGLLGQVFIGVTWGMPGAQWLAEATQEVFAQLGYLGLLLLVYEGGLSTSFSSLQANLFLSIAVALTGICLPIGLSFALLPFTNATTLQAFAAGAALCSTSLGTTFTVLKTSDLTKSRLGVVLTSAAMMDDVVGLVMVQVISNLKPGGAAISATTVVRPIFVSLAFAVLVPLCSRWMILPGWRRLESRTFLERFKQLLRQRAMVFLVQTCLLLSFVTGASYAGTSNLFAAYLAGTMISWWDSVSAPPAGQRRPASASSADLPRNGKGLEKGDRINTVRHRADGQPPSQELLTLDAISKTPNLDQAQATVQRSPSKARNTSSESAGTTLPVSALTGVAVYEHYYSGVVDKMLKPLFFASIGFSIPISQMFRGPVIWRGFVYACLMAVGKLFCGLWLVRFDLQQGFRLRRRDSKDDAGRGTKTKAVRRDHAAKTKAQPSGLQKPKSLYPASILGAAMVARGEIGFLVSAIAQSNGVFDSANHGRGSERPNQDLFLIVTWAIMLCTVAGPVTVGLIVRRARRLQNQRKESAGRELQADPLGIWGLDPGD